MNEILSRVKIIISSEFDEAKYLGALQEVEASPLKFQEEYLISQRLGAFKAVTELVDVYSKARASPDTLEAYLLISKEAQFSPVLVEKLVERVE